MTSRAPRKQASHAEVIKIYEYLKAHHSSLGGLTFEALATKLTHDLGFEVGKATVASISNEHNFGLGMVRVLRSDVRDADLKKIEADLSKLAFVLYTYFNKEGYRGASDLTSLMRVQMPAAPSMSWPDTTRPSGA
jgi:hypothetical protein